MMVRQLNLAILKVAIFQSEDIQIEGQDGADSEVLSKLEFTPIDDAEKQWAARGLWLMLTSFLAQI